MLKKTATLTAIAALAVPALATADKPADAGSKGKTQSAAAKSKQKGVGFTAAGLWVSGFDGLTTDSKEQRDVSDFTLNLTSANKHARTFLGLATKPSSETPVSKEIDAATGDKAVIRLIGFDSTDVIDATDRVKVIGKVTRVRKGDTTTTRVLDIRRITIKDVEPETAPETPAS